jgi:hypothetical protein
MEVQHRLAFIHTSPAAIGPLNKYYADKAPEYEIVNLLDDGILEFYRIGDEESAVDRVLDMVNASVRVYNSDAAMVTCSAVSLDAVANVASAVPIPVIKVDVPMAKKAVRSFGSIGLVVTFAPGGKAAHGLLVEMASREGTEPAIEFILVDGAYDALLSGDSETHDNLLLQAVSDHKDQVDAFVLSQVSMAGLQEKCEQVAGKPVLTSPKESLTAIKELFD